MNQKQNNWNRGGRGGNRRFGGTRSLGNYNNVGSHYNNAQDDNQRSGSWGNFNRPHDNNGNHGNKNKNFDNRNLSSLNDQDGSFEKFRDPYGQRQNNNNMRSKFPQDRGQRNRGRRGGKHFENETPKSGKLWFEDINGSERGQNESLVQNFTVANSSPTIKNVPEVVSSAIDTHVNSPAINETNQNSFPSKPESEKEQPLIKNIKQEQIEKKEAKRNLKPPTSSSSSESSSESENELPKKEINKTKAFKVKTETPVKQNQKNIKNKSSSSSSSSSEEDGEDSTKTSTVPNIVSKASVEKLSKNTKKQMGKKSSEEDLICLGKLEKKFVIEDDVSEAEGSERTKAAALKNQCLICDKQGHTAFECQMICKNCSAPYHNMKNCPQPANLSTMLLTFMDFCMKQVGQFNPEQKFVLPMGAKTNENPLPMSETGLKKISKKSRSKSREPLKKTAQRKRRHTSDSSEEEDEAKNNDTEEDTSETETESDSSEEVAVPKSKKKRTKAPVRQKPTDFPNSFVPPFSSFPAFGAAAAAYNPLLLGQLMHGATFPTPQKPNF
ncbi:protein mushroom body miniature [Ceratitis capitata]|uniref:(Mediterranean fruit fly) hypothetical protein n=1 Tax=Ceratitis capitata TaxID=7213 RepID=W8C634_CERCA|nr:protein mushroom body miniature [Ceratitis capitata]CAD6999375.1 unnamed protein product [Ceratitis capitata]